MEYQLLALLLSYYVLILLFCATCAAARATHDHTIMHTHYYQPSTSFIHLAGARKGDGASGIRHVKTYLRRFGYFKDDLNNLGINNEVDDQFDEPLERAILTYQDFFKLNKTGVLDKDTITMMSKPRCGNPDIRRPAHDGNRKAAHDVNKHFKRHYQLTPGNARRNKPYVYFEFDPSVPITLKDSINQAFADWERYVPLMFLRSFDPESSNVVFDIRAGFYEKYHGCGASFDGPGGVLAHASVGSGPVLHFDIEEIWRIGAAPDGTDIRTVARHEIGHLLGLEHSSDPNALMYPTLGMGVVREIGDDDKAGIKALYYG